MVYIIIIAANKILPLPLCSSGVVGLVMERERDPTHIQFLPMAEKTVTGSSQPLVGAGGAGWPQEVQHSQQAARKDTVVNSFEIEKGNLENKEKHHPTESKKITEVSLCFTCIAF